MHNSVVAPGALRHVLHENLQEGWYRYEMWKGTDDEAAKPHVCDCEVDVITGDHATTTLFHDERYHSWQHQSSRILRIEVLTIANNIIMNHRSPDKKTHGPDATYEDAPMLLLPDHSIWRLLGVLWVTKALNLTFP